MTARQALRAALLGEWAAVIAAIILSVLLQDRLPEPLRDWLKAEEERPADGRFWAMAAVGLAIFVAMIASTIGLLRSRRWGLHLGLATSLLSYGLSPAFGPTVSDAFSYAAVSLATCLNGVVLALGYFSDALQAPAPAGPTESR